MKVRTQITPDRAEETERALNVKATLLTSAEQEYTVTILNADDSFDIIVQYPNGERECVWSMMKE